MQNCAIQKRKTVLCSQALSNHKPISDTFTVPPRLLRLVHVDNQLIVILLNSIIFLFKNIIK